MPLKFSFRNALEDHPGSKYFLSNEMYKFCTEHDQYCRTHNLGHRFVSFERESCEIAKTITTKEGARIDSNFIREPVHTDSKTVRKANVEKG